MAHAVGTAEGAAPHCEACAARARAVDGLFGRTRRAVVGWLARINGTPVSDIGRADLGAIRRLAEA